MGRGQKGGEKNFFGGRSQIPSRPTPVDESESKSQKIFTKRRGEVIWSLRTIIITKFWKRNKFSVRITGKIMSPTRHRVTLSPPRVILRRGGGFYFEEINFIRVRLREVLFFRKNFVK
jgi:hypothetical protein